MLMRFRWPPYLLLALAPLCWAGNIVLGRAIYHDISPISLNFWRWVVAAAVLLPFAAGGIRDHWPLIRRNLGLFSVLAFSAITLFNTFMYVALTTTTAINVALMQAMNPIVISAMAYLFHRDSLTARQVFGISVSLAGVLVLISRGEAANLTALRFTPGDLWMVAAVPLWALYSVLLKRCPASVPPIVLVTVIACLGLLFLLPAYLWELVQVGGFAVNGPNLASIAYAGLIASVVAFFAWNGGVAAVGVNKAGPFMHLVPVFGALLAILILGEVFRLYHLTAAIPIVLGISLSATATGTFRGLVRR